ncbi:hypothetical protein QFZ63_006007 [Streptomyces sp. B3I7]|uniref:hypothetical protein n=1 Tax=Streptomyces sp. B3I7 TaxID=3042269 RepID=UPI0027879502|nr:hypothetical protein [Streptomyces sp. B3I7]MDQ0814293.1 hypothetical protein [Streptomyces sp. B3I7]
MSREKRIPGPDHPVELVENPGPVRVPLHPTTGPLHLVQERHDPGCRYPPTG